MWYKQEDFVEKLIDPTRIESRIKCEFIDIPEVYHYKDDNF
jgi:hypothetical protein